MPCRICLIVIAGFHPSSSFRIDKQTVPDGYTFGWKRGGTNLPVVVQSQIVLQFTIVARALHFGGLVGYSGARSQYQGARLFIMNM